MRLNSWRRIFIYTKILLRRVLIGKDVTYTTVLLRCVLVVSLCTLKLVELEAGCG